METKEIKTRVCECCGRELPETSFIRRNFGISKICKDCNAKRIVEAKKRKKQVASLEHDLDEARKARLAEFTPRELMEELVRRGYRGKLEYVDVKTVDLSKL